MRKDFMQGILEGLKGEKKRISSKYLYDEKGSQLFQQIMEQPEYYLTAAEWNIFEHAATDIIKKVVENASSKLQIMELGAGDGRKTELILDELDKLKFPCVYEPVDIDPSVLYQLVSRIGDKYQFIEIEPRPGYNHEALQHVDKNRTSLIMFLGSNIGNYTRQEEENVMKGIGSAMKPGDQLLLGADKVKDPNIISAAYNDKNKVTAAFNLNLIQRLNKVTSSSLDPNCFEFYSFYHPQQKEVRAFLVNREQQTIHLSDQEDINLPAWTFIQTETSRKYTLEDLKDLGLKSGLHIIEHWEDQKNYFFELLYTKK